MKLVYILSIVLLSSTISCMDPSQNPQFIYEKQRTEIAALAQFRDLIRQRNLDGFKKDIYLISADLLKVIGFNLIDEVKNFDDNSYLDVIFERYDDLELSIRDWEAILSGKTTAYAREIILAKHSEKDEIIAGIAKRRASDVVTGLYWQYPNEMDLMGKEIEAELYRRKFEDADLKGKVVAFLKKNQTTLLSSAFALAAGVFIARNYKTKKQDQQ